MLTGGVGGFSTRGWLGVKLEDATGLKEEAGEEGEAIVDAWEQKLRSGLVEVPPGAEKGRNPAVVCLVCSY